MPIPMPVWLLDKSVVRRTIEGVSASLVAAPLTAEQSLALRLLRRGTQASVAMMITPETANILSHHSDLWAVRLFQTEVSPMCRGRYFLRWAHRLREHGFTREDAKVLSYGTFGLDMNGLTPGGSAVATFDVHLIHNFDTQRLVLVHRLRLMAAHLPEPYRGARLPEVVTPGDLLV